MHLFAILFILDKGDELENTTIKLRHMDTSELFIIGIYYVI